MPKYSLLLKDLLKNTNPMHPDYKNIEEALVKFNKVCFDFNNDQGKWA